MWICKICKKNDYYPMISIDCGHSFCSNCIQKLKICPLCKTDIKKYIQNHDLFEMTYYPNNYDSFNYGMK